MEILHIKSVSENQTEVTIAVSEKSVTGSSRKVLATELSGFLNQPTQKQQLAGVGVVNIVPYVTPSKGQIENYLKVPPPG